MNTIDTNKLTEIGLYISKNINNTNIDKCNLIIDVNESFFKKIDEDLFYKLNDNNKDLEFIPSESEIILNFPKCEIIIKKT